MFFFGRSLLFQWLLPIESVVLDLLFNYLCANMHNAFDNFLSCVWIAKSFFLAFLNHLHAYCSSFEHFQIVLLLFYISIVYLLFKSTIQYVVVSTHFNSQLQRLRNFTRLITFSFTKKIFKYFVDLLIWKTIIIKLKVFVCSSSCKQYQEWLC